MIGALTQTSRTGSMRRRSHTNIKEYQFRFLLLPAVFSHLQRVWAGRSSGTVEWRDGRAGRSSGTVEWDGRVGQSSGISGTRVRRSSGTEWDYRGTIVGPSSGTVESDGRVRLEWN